MIRTRAPLGWGLALREDGTGCLAGVTAADPKEYEKVDRKLLALAREHAPGPGFSHLDAMILMRMGKDISGAGMDPDVIGRHRRRGEPAPPGAPWIGVLRLTEASGGNAIGVGMADMVSRQLAGAIDGQATRANAAASGWESGAEVPAVAPSDAALLAHACLPAGRRVVIARDTAHLGRILVSPALAGEVRDRTDLEAQGPPQPLLLDQQGNLDMDLLPL